MPAITCFKAYDLRGRLGVDLDEGVAHAVGRGFAAALGARTVVAGCDCRLSSEGLAAAWKSVELHVSGTNYLGKLLRDNGQSRVPDPPQSRMG